MPPGTIGEGLLHTLASAVHLQPQSYSSGPSSKQGWQAQGSMPTEMINWSASCPSKAPEPQCGSARTPALVLFWRAGGACSLSAINAVESTGESCPLSAIMSVETTGVETGRKLISDNFSKSSLADKRLMHALNHLKYVRMACLISCRRSLLGSTQTCFDPILCRPQRASTYVSTPRVSTPYRVSTSFPPASDDIFIPT